MLHRVPGRQDAGAEAAVQFRQRGGEAGEFLLLLEGRVDQHQAALLGEGREGADRLPGVAAMHRHLRVAREMGAQRGMVLGVQLAAGQAVPLPQRRADQRGGTGIARREALRRQRRDEVRERPFRGARQPQRAARRFPRAGGFLGREVIGAPPRMGVEHREGRGLAPQRIEQQEQQRVLQAIRVVAGMEGVAVVHGGAVIARGGPGRNRAAREGAGRRCPRPRS